MNCQWDGDDVPRVLYILECGLRHKLLAAVIMRASSPLEKVIAREQLQQFQGLKTW